MGRERKREREIGKGREKGQVRLYKWNICYRWRLIPVGDDMACLTDAFGSFHHTSPTSHVKQLFAPRNTCYSGPTGHTQVRETMLHTSGLLSHQATPVSASKLQFHYCHCCCYIVQVCDHTVHECVAVPFKVL